MRRLLGLLLFALTLMACGSITNTTVTTTSGESFVISRVTTPDKLPGVTVRSDLKIVIVWIRTDSIKGNVKDDSRQASITGSDGSSTKSTPATMFTLGETPETGVIFTPPVNAKGFTLNWPNATAPIDLGL